MRIYTKTGDKGETGLIGGKRVHKDSLRIEAYGNVDELNAILGLAVSFLGETDLASHLRMIQDELFTIGADLASPGKDSVSGKTIPKIEASGVTRLEQIIDSLEEKLPFLRSFILPCGSPGACALHTARAVARRAERSVVALSKVEQVNPEIIKYLNRFSDLLFVMARAANFHKGIEETAPTYRV